jgi:hypothetical protein
MGSRNMMGSSANIQVNADGGEKRLHEKQLPKVRLLMAKKQNLFYSHHCAQGVTGSIGGRMWPRETSWLRGSLRGCMWPQRVAGGLGGSGVALGVTDGLVGLQMALGAVGCFVGSWVTLGGRRWPMGVTVDFGGSRVTLITYLIFTNAPNFRIKLLT